MNNTKHNLQKKLLGIFLLVTFIFILIAFRLAYLQLIKSGWLKDMANNQWTRSLPIEAKRGDIQDRNGVALATSYSSYDVYVRPSMIDSVEEVSIALSTCLHMDYEVVYNKIYNKKISEVLIKKQVSLEDVSHLNTYNLKGIYYSENSTRYYPYGDLASQVIGITNIDNIGQAGLEMYYDEYLVGVDGRYNISSDVKGVAIEDKIYTYQDSVSGLNINLTLDVRVQQSLENALVKLMREQKPKTATGIVMDPNTGEILAMSTKPSYDLNNPNRADMNSLLSAMKNVSVVDVYEPGSTFKVLTMAAALDTGKAQLTDRFYDPGYVIIDGEKIKCWKHTGHGSQTLTEGLCNSCNAVFTDLALRLGLDTFYEYFDKYGLGDSLGVDFFGEATGIVMNKGNVKTVDLARMGFGQAIAVSPIQLISAICSVLNGGNLMKPYFLKSIETEDGRLIKEITPTLLNRTISEDTSEKIKVMFEEVVKQYTGIGSFIPGYRVGGKTGTTQKYNENGISGEYIASFVGGYPANDPKYVVLILADEPSGDSYYGSVVATPYAKLVFEDIIAMNNDEPSADLDEDIARMEADIELPNLVGMPLTRAVAILAELNLQYEVAGSGDTILSMTPSPKYMVHDRAVVILTT
ncbi:MAG: hypothetical protein E7361_04370 [Clostridiales bacterium]|nr:hypothetical protein [Clostridiales bacterium]